MSLTNTVVRHNYISGASQTIFPYTFIIYNSSDLKVYSDGVLQSEGGDYTVSGVGSPSGGDVTYVVGQASGTRVAILSDVPNTQIEVFTPNSNFSEADFERQLDRTVRLVQQVDSKIDSTVSFDESSFTSGITIPNPGGNAKKSLTVNDAETGLDWVRIVPDATSQTGKVLTATTGGNYVWSTSVAVTPGTLPALGSNRAKVLGVNSTETDTEWVSAGQGVVSVFEYGAVGDGITDDTTAFQDAVDNADHIYVPPGDYLIDGSVVIPNFIQIFGGGIGSRIVVTNDTETTFDCSTADHVRIENIFIEKTGAPRTGGIFIHLKDFSYVNQVFMTGGFRGIYVQGSFNRMRNTTAWMFANSTSSIGIEVEDTGGIGEGDNNIIDNCYFLGTVASEMGTGISFTCSSPATGIFSNQVSNCYMSDCNQGIEFNIVSESSLIQANNVVNCSMESCLDAGINIIGGSSGGSNNRVFNRNSFSNIYMAENQDGIICDGNTAFNVANNSFTGIHVINCDIYGMFLENADNNSVIASTFDGNNEGLRIHDAGSANNVVTNCVMVSNVTYGFIDFGTNTIYENSVCSGNGAAGQLFSLSAVANRYRNILGRVFDNSGSDFVGAGLGTVAVSHGLDVTPNISNIQIIPTTIDGRTWGIVSTAPTVFTLAISLAAAQFDFEWRIIVPDPKES
jgi:hypothetical protein